MLTEKHYHHYEVIETPYFEAGKRIRLTLGVPAGDLQLLPGERWLGDFETGDEAERFIARQGGVSC